MCRTNLKNYIYNNMYLYFLNFPRKQRWERNEAGCFTLFCSFCLERWERNEAGFVALFYIFCLDWERNEKTILICIVLTKTYLLFFFIIYKLRRLYIFFLFSFLILYSYLFILLFSLILLYYLYRGNSETFFS